MNDKVDIFLEEKVWEVLGGPKFANLSIKEKTDWAKTIRASLNNVIFETVLSLFNQEQLNILKDLDMESVEFEAKFGEFSSQIPDLGLKIEESLKKEVEKLKAG